MGLFLGFTFESPSLFVRVVWREGPRWQASINSGDDRCTGVLVGGISKK
jgi:hypothetical protein